MISISYLFEVLPNPGIFIQFIKQKASNHLKTENTPEDKTDQKKEVTKKMIKKIQQSIAEE